MKTNLSSCCNAEALEESIGGTTWFYKCTECKMPCDLSSPEVVATNSEKINSKLTANLASSEVIEKWDLVLAFKDRMIKLNAGDVLTKDTIEEIGEYINTKEKEAYERGFDEACLLYQKEPFNKDK